MESAVFLKKVSSAVMCRCTEEGRTRGWEITEKMLQS